MELSNQVSQQNDLLDEDSMMNANPGGLINDRHEEEEKSRSGQLTPTAELEPRINQLSQPR